MEATLHAAGVEVVYVEIPDADHFDMNWSVAAPWALTFFGIHLEPER